MRNITGFSRSAWSWIPTLYLAEGIPYVAVMTIAVIMYDRMGISHTDIAFYTAWLYLPWVIKPLWSPFVDILRTRRWWIVVMQFLVGAAMAGVAFTLPAPFFFRATLAFFWLMAFSSATHDIAADGFYMLALSTHEQSFFVGIRSTFYRIAMIAGQGLLVMVAGQLEIYTRVEVAWSLTFGAMALLFVVFAVYHLRVLPHPQSDKVGTVAVAVVWREFVETFVSFFRKPGIGITLLFLLTYRLAEAQLVKLASLFLLDERIDGGLALTTAQVGFVYGTVGVIALTVGGIMGGWAVSPLRVAPMFVADGIGSYITQFGIFVPVVGAAILHDCSEHVCRCRAVGLWIRIYRLYALYDSFFGGKTCYGALCVVYRFYGVGYDVSRNGCRLDCRSCGICSVFYLDYDMYGSGFCRVTVFEDT